jgi:hypothetical protein
MTGAEQRLKQAAEQCGASGATTAKSLKSLSGANCGASGATMAKSLKSLMRSNAEQAERSTPIPPSALRTRLAAVRGAFLEGRSDA